MSTNPNQGAGFNADYDRHHRPLTNVLDIAPRSLWFINKRGVVGMVKLFWAVACIGVGSYLISEISATPGLGAQLALLGALGIVSGIAMGALAVRDLGGRLRVSSQGIEVRPRLGGFHVSWDKLQAWKWSPEVDQPVELQQLQLWKRGESLPKVLPASWLSEADRQWLRQTLSGIAPNK